jgi:hypothetical protein
MRLFESLERQEFIDVQWSKYRVTMGRDLLGKIQSNIV